MTTLADIAAWKLSDIRRKPPVTVAPGDSLASVVEKLQTATAVIVVRDGALVGIFTERDLMARIDHSNPSWQDTPIAEVMTKSPKTIRTDQTLEDALNLMLVGVYRHIPTVTPDGKPEGMVSILDLLVHITEFFPQDFTNLPVDPDHEASGPWGG